MAAVIECASDCGREIEPDHWRWTCPNCGRAVHYSCIDGGVPVKELPRCAACTSVMRSSDREDPGQLGFFDG